MIKMWMRGKDPGGLGGPPATENDDYAPDRMNCIHEMFKEDIDQSQASLELMVYQDVSAFPEEDFLQLEGSEAPSLPSLELPVATAPASPPRDAVLHKHLAALHKTRRPIQKALRPSGKAREKRNMWRYITAAMNKHLERDLYKKQR